MGSRGGIEGSRGGLEGISRGSISGVEGAYLLEWAGAQHPGEQLRGDALVGAVGGGAGALQGLAKPRHPLPPPPAPLP